MVLIVKTKNAQHKKKHLKMITNTHITRYLTLTMSDAEMK